MSDQSGAPKLFDRQALRRHRKRAAGSFADHDFLLREIGARLLERLEETLTSFPVALDLGCHNGVLASILAQQEQRGETRIDSLLQCDLSATMIGQAKQQGPAFVADEEWLPCGAGSLDLVLSLFSLQWVNDLPGVLAQIRYALKPGGLFLAAFPGGVTLGSLRQAFLEAESETVGGVSPRIAPFIEVREAGMLLQRAGFQLPMADADVVPIDYPDPLALLRDLRGMGESNALNQRPRSFLRRDTLAALLQAYPQRPDGRVVAEVEVVYLTGWAPDASP
ncbi:MAG: methyltransferase domain-containing protein [Kiloniellales bacterium]